MSNRFKSGDCYIAKLPNGESPVRLVEKTELGYWKTRSLKHGRVVIVKNESLFLRPCTENDLISCAVTVRPNRSSFRSLDEMRERIASFIDYFNETLAKPYRWTYTGTPLKI